MKFSRHSAGPEPTFPSGPLPPFLDRLRQVSSELADETVVTPADRDRALDELLGPGVAFDGGRVTGQTVRDAGRVLGNVRRVGRIIGIVAALAMAATVLIQVAH